jgi:predicted nucleic acid-binding protein
MSPIFIDSSAVLRSVLERGLSRSAERALAASRALIVSRLALVETARAFHRVRLEKRVTDKELSKAEHDVEALWSRCDIWEISRPICNTAMAVAPSAALRTLDAIHVATFLAARKRIPDLRLLTTDARMREAASTLGLRTAPS